MSKVAPLLSIALANVAIVVPAGAKDAALSDHGSELARIAIQQNPSVAAVKNRIRGLRYRVKRAGAWLDPRVAVEYSNMPIDAWIPGRHPMSGIQFKLQQTFLFPGKTHLREKEAAGFVRQTQQTLAEVKVQLAAAVRRAYYQLALVRQLKDVTNQHIKLVDQFIVVVRAKYIVGKAGQHDLIRLRVLRGKLRDDLRNFDRDDRSLVSKINATLHRATTVPIATPKRLQSLGAPTSLSKLVSQTRTTRPALRVQSEIARTRRVAAKRVAREGYPDFTTWVGYRVRVSAGPDAGTDFVGLGLSVPIPIFYNRRFDNERRTNEALASAAESKRKAMLDQIRGALSSALAAWRRAKDQATAYRTKLMPAAHKALDATFAAYQVDRADFASLFQAELQLLEFERTIFRAEAETHLRRVEVEALVGKKPS